MSLFVIADLHLSTLNEDKSMEVFGDRWSDYLLRIEKNWRAIITEKDTVVIPGDISWGLTLEEAKSDLLFISSLPGKKILGKGNHDYWWGTVGKMNRFFDENGIDSISLLYNNAYETDNFIIAGSRGWYQDSSSPNIPENADYEKVLMREAARLKTSLDSAMAISGGKKETLVFLHFPPIWNEEECVPITDCLKQYGIKRVFFGHIHGGYSAQRKFEKDGITYNLISADHLSFIPQLIT